MAIDKIVKHTGSEGKTLEHIKEPYAQVFEGCLPVIYKLEVDPSVPS